jgi:ferric-dicitrate binding protein FerR (iron transport regulator)
MTDEEDVTAQLLRLTGTPPGPSAERTARVRAQVHGEWRALRHRRMGRRVAATALAGLAVAAALVIAVWIRPRPATTTPAGRTVATSQRLQGRPLLVRGQPRGAERLTLAGSMSIRAGDVIETDDMSRASLQTIDGSSLRIDVGSRVRLVAPEVVELVAGAAYVATSAGSRGFEVRTSMGAVRDIGTQFEVRLVASSLRLRVRAGTVELHRGADVTAAAAGTEATVTTSGVAVRQVPAYGSEWAWTAAVAPSFVIEGRPLRAFLEHTAIEEGWTLRYADRSVEEAAGRTLLHGSVEGLRAEEAIQVALATSGLEHRVRNGELLVSRPAAAR